MMSRAIKNGLFTEETVKQSLVRNKGDIFLCACEFEMSVREFDRYIRRSTELQSFAASIDKIKNDPAYDAMSSSQFEEEVSRLAKSYKLDALNQIYELASMDIQDNASLAMVKLKAAQTLYGNNDHQGKNNEVAAVLTDLNRLYLQNAPRIKEIRHTIVTLEDTQAKPQQIFESL